MDDPLGLLKRIRNVSGMLGGKPNIRGMRFLVTDIVEMLSSGMSKKKILKQHPLLEPEDIEAAIIYNDISQAKKDYENGDYITLAQFEDKYKKYLKD